jgi:hypothetical protein
MHEGLCVTLADVIKHAYWALVHSGGSPARGEHPSGCRSW